MKIGYVIISNRVMIDGLKVAYLYRESPDNERDSGWRVFGGDEDQDYADDASNFAFYNASTLLGFEPQLEAVLAAPAPVAYERLGDSSEFVQVDDDFDEPDPR